MKKEKLYDILYKAPHIGLAKIIGIDAAYDGQLLNGGLIQGYESNPIVSTIVNGATLGVVGASIYIGKRIKNRREEVYKKVDGIYDAGATAVSTATGFLVGFFVFPAIVFA